MADAPTNTSDLQPQRSRHSVHEESDDDSADETITPTSYTEEARHYGLSPQLEQRRATCRYFDNYPPSVHARAVVDNDYFYKEHLKSCHFSPCEPLPAPRDGILPDEPPMHAEVLFCLMTCRLTPVKLREKLLSSRHIRLVRLPPSQQDCPSS
jgi:hypothetical protein